MKDLAIRIRRMILQRRLLDRRLGHKTPSTHVSLHVRIEEARVIVRALKALGICKYTDK